MCSHPLSTGKNTNNNKLIRLFQIFGAKLVLEVFGGAGAIWGFSEAIGLRSSSTIWFWRPCALLFGAVFFWRWIFQMRDYIMEEEIWFGRAVSGNSEQVIMTEKEKLAPQAENFYS